MELRSEEKETVYYIVVGKKEKQTIKQIIKQKNNKIIKQIVKQIVK